jgi:hypothetical protein
MAAVAIQPALSGYRCAAGVPKVTATHRGGAGVPAGGAGGVASAPKPLAAVVLPTVATITTADVGLDRFVENEDGTLSIFGTGIHLKLKGDVKAIGYGGL